MKKYFAVVLSIFVLSCFTALNVFSQEILTRVGNSCPTKYASSGDDCLPLAGAKYAIAKIGNRCPVGFSIDGNYCYRPQKGTTKVIPKVGKQCPAGFWADGEYCQSFK